MYSKSSIMKYAELVQFTCML